MGIEIQFSKIRYQFAYNYPDSTNLPKTTREHSEDVPLFEECPVGHVLEILCCLNLSFALSKYLYQSVLRNASVLTFEKSCLF